MQPSSVCVTCCHQNQGRNIADTTPLCRDLSTHALPHSLPAALTPIWIAPAAVSARSISHVLSVTGNFLR